MQLMFSSLDILRQDIAYAVRGMRRAPGFLVAVVVVLGVGAGANAAVFDVLDRLLLRAPAAVLRPADLRRLTVQAGFNQGPRLHLELFSAPDHDVLKRDLSGVADVAAYSVEGPYSLDGGERSTAVAFVTTNYFGLLGVKPRVGRAFAVAEANYRDPRYIAVISDALWRTRFGAEAAIVGRKILIDTVTFVIVGVAPPAFSGLELDPVEIWAPLPTRPIGAEGPWFDQGGSWFLHIVARPSGVSTAASVASRATAAVRRLHAGDEWFDPTAQVFVDPLVSAEGLSTRREVSDRSVSLIVRLAGVAVLILILTACNVGGLQLMRMASRRNEFAIRLALGSSVRRLARQLLTEAVLLALAGSLVAIEVGGATSGLLRRVVFANIRWSAGNIDKRLVLLALASVTLVAVFAGLAPLASIAWREATGLLHLSPSAEHRRGSRIRASLLVVQTALCIALLGAAGAVVMSLHRATVVDVGIDARRLVTVSAEGIGVSRETAAMMRERLAALPFVAAVAQAAADVRPGGIGGPIQLPGQSVVKAPYAPTYNAVEPGFFGVAGLRVREGRPFSELDVAGAEAVAVINRSMAHQYWPNGNVLGSCFIVGSSGCRRIVGIADDVRWGFSVPAVAHYYLPLAQEPRWGNLVFVIRTRTDVSPADLSRIKQLTVSLLGSTKGTPPVRGVAERLALLLKPLQVASTVFLLFGVLALFSALAGIFGTVSFDTARRYREIGIRIALGANPSRIVSTILGSVARLIGAGIAAGLVLLLIVGKFLANILFETTLYGSWITLMIAALFLLAGLLAGLLPALRASRADPADILSAE
jgi:predicted permease